MGPNMETFNLISYRPKIIRAWQLKLDILYDLFAGIGGMRKGFEAHGGKSVSSR
jgi:hypothetical protein